MESRAKDPCTSARRQRAVGGVQVVLACLCGAAFLVQRTCGQAAVPPYIQGSWKVIYKVSRSRPDPLSRFSAAFSLSFPLCTHAVPT